MVDFADEAIMACLTDTAKKFLGTKLVGGALVREDPTVGRLLPQSKMPGSCYRFQR